MFCLNEKMQCIFSLLKTPWKENSNFDKEEISVFWEASGKIYTVILQAFTQIPFHIHVVSLHSWDNTSMQMSAPGFYFLVQKVFKTLQPLWQNWVLKYAFFPHKVIFYYAILAFLLISSHPSDCLLRGISKILLT